MITVQVNHAIPHSVNKLTIEQAARQVFMTLNLSAESDLSIILEDDKHLQTLNLKYLGINAPTDVLSFPAGHIDPDTHSVYLGDVIISVPQAQSQATARNHLLVDELQLLVVHGVLHLIGYDHLEEEDKKKMQAVQDEILKQLGSKVTTTL